MGVSARIVTIGVAGGAIIVAAGCGSSAPSSSAGGNGAAKAPSTSELTSSMRQSVSRADSVHVDGHLSNNGLPVTVNLNVTRNGGVSGTVSENGAPLQVVAVNSKVYFKATAGLPQSGEGTVRRLLPRLREVDPASAAAGQATGRRSEHEQPDYRAEPGRRA